MTRDDAIEILKYKVRMFDSEVNIGDLDKTNIEAIKILLDYIKELQHKTSELEGNISEIRKLNLGIEPDSSVVSLYAYDDSISIDDDNLRSDLIDIQDKINEIIDYLKNEGE